MKSLRFAFFFAILVSMFAVAESNQAPAASQTSHKHPQGSALSFATAVTYSSGGLGANSLAVADVNGDGKPDIVVVNNDGTLGVLLGNGDGTFQAAVSYKTGDFNPDSVALADVNADGKPDIIVANFCADDFCDDGAVGVLLGNGNGTFQPAVTYDAKGTPQSVAVADLNGDGKPDIVAANHSGGLSILFGNGDGTFQPAVTLPTGGTEPTSVAVADINGDDNPDIVVANGGSGTVAALLGNGDGTFQTPVPYGSGGSNPYSVAIGDVNGDTRPDIVVANGGSDTTGVLLGNGDGTFQGAVTYPTPVDPFSVAIADVNGDFNPDIVTSLCASCANGLVGVLLGNGDGTFQTLVSYGSGGFGPYGITAVDVSKDGKPDLLVTNVCNNEEQCTTGLVGVLINTSLGPTTTALASSPNPSSFGQAVTFTATVTPKAFKGMPTGSVSFFDGATNIGNSNLNSAGIAALTTSTLAVGTHTITATYNGDANFAPSTSSPLYQVVQGAIAVLSPTGINFGNQTVDIASSPRMVTLQNTGNINLTITAIQITGQNAGDFSQKNNCPASLPPNKSCQMNVTFKPTTAGTRNAAVSVTDNAPGSPQSASLTGVGVLPAVTFSPTSLTFSATVVFSASAPQKVTLTNTGLGILEITGARISPQFGVTTDCGKTLASGASCTASVTFKPTTKGPINGSISLTDNAPNSPQQVPLSGTGTFVQLTPTSLNFGTQPVNTTSVPKVITLVNKGDATVNFTGTGISIGGADPNDFAQTNNCGTSVASGGHCYIKVTFTPSQLGSRTGDVSISDDGGGSPQVVLLSGTGTP